MATICRSSLSCQVIPLEKPSEEVIATVSRQSSNSSLLTGQFERVSSPQRLQSSRFKKRKGDKLQTMTDQEANLRRLRSNKQERVRQKGITLAFKKLFEILPPNAETVHKIGSKIYILESAISYMRGLNRMLHNYSSTNPKQKANIISHDYSKHHIKEELQVNTVWYNQLSSSSLHEKLVARENMRRKTVLHTATEESHRALNHNYNGNLHNRQKTNRIDVNQKELRNPLVATGIRTNYYKQNAWQDSFVHCSKPLVQDTSLRSIDQVISRPPNEKESISLPRYEYMDSESRHPTSSRAFVYHVCNQSHSFLHIKPGIVDQNRIEQLEGTLNSIDCSDGDNHIPSLDSHTISKNPSLLGIDVSVKTSCSTDPYSSSYTPNNNYTFRRGFSVNDSGYFSGERSACNSEVTGCNNETTGCNSGVTGCNSEGTGYNSRDRDFKMCPMKLEFDVTNLPTFSPERVNKPLSQLIYRTKDMAKKGSGSLRKLHFDSF